MRKSDEVKQESSCWNKAEPNEYTFILLGRDLAASAAIQAWIKERLRLGLNDPKDAQIQEAVAAAGKMAATSIAHKLGIPMMDAKI